MLFSFLHVAGPPVADDTFRCRAAAGLTNYLGSWKDRGDQHHGVILIITRIDERCERIRKGLLRAAVEAYEDAGFHGLYAEGRSECTVGAIGSLDLAKCGDLQPRAAPSTPVPGRAETPSE